MKRTLAITALVVAALALPCSAQAAVPSGFVGITSEDLLNASPQYQASQLKAQRRAGVRLLRQTFTWAEIEESLGRYKWTKYDRLVLAAASAGITVLPILFDPPGALSRPPGAPGNFTYPPLHNSLMGRFAAATMARYGVGGSLWAQNPGVRARPFRAVQVWNEPSLRAYWGGRPSASAYVALLKAANDAIKARDRRAEVVTAGIPPSVLSGSVPIRKYIDQMYKAGAKSAFDTLAVNTYSRSVFELRKLLKSIRGIMNRRGDRRARIWITELGWCDRGVRHRFCVGRKKQSSLITGSLREIRRTRRALRLRGFVYYSWRDGRPYAPTFRDFWGLHTGLLKLDGKPKPAYRAFTRAVRGFR